MLKLSPIQSLCFINRTQCKIPVEENDYRQFDSKHSIINQGICSTIKHVQTALRFFDSKVSPSIQKGQSSICQSKLFKAKQSNQSSMRDSYA